MKYIKRFLAVILASVFVLVVASCEKGKDIDFPSHSKELGVDRFLKTDWGMSLEQTLEALGLEKSDVETIDNALGLGVDDLNRTAYKIKEKMEVNGLKASVVLTFYDKASDLFEYTESDKKDTYVGLAQVSLQFNEDNIEKVYKAFEKELGDKENWNKDMISASPGEGETVTVNKGTIDSLKDEKLKEDIISIMTDSSTEETEKKHLLSTPIALTIVVTDTKDVSGNLGISQVVDYNAGAMAIINNLEK